MIATQANPFGSFTRRVSRIAPGLALLVAAWAQSATYAQTWDYSLSSTALTSLPTLPQPAEVYFTTIRAVATDAQGDVYLAVVSSDEDQIDYFYKVFEVVAVDGQISSSSSVVAVDLTSVAKGLAGVALDLSGNVYVTDGYSKVFEIVATSGKISSTSTVSALGNGWNFPNGIAVDAHGNIFVADTGNHAIKELDWGESGGIVHIKYLFTETVSTRFVSPMGLAFDSRGDLFVSDQASEGVSELTPVSGSISSSSPISQVGSSMAYPGALVIDASGNLLIATGDIGQATTIEEIMPSGGSFAPLSAAISIGLDLTGTTGLAVLPNGSLLVADQNVGLAEVQAPVADFGAIPVGSTSSTMMIPYHFSTAGTLTGWEILTEGKSGADFSEVTGSTNCSTTDSNAAGNTCTIAVQFTPKSVGTRAGAVVFHVENSGFGLRYSVVSVPLKGTGVAARVSYPGMHRGTVVATGFSQPWGLAVDGSGNVYVADMGNAAVKEIVATGGAVSAGSQVVTLAGSLNLPSAVALDGAGNLYVADSQYAGDKVILASTSQNPGFPSILSTSHAIQTSSTGMAIDGTGNVFLSNAADSSGDGSVLVSRSSNGQPFSAFGFRLPLPGNTNVWGVAVDAGGNVYYTDNDEGAVREVVAVNGGVAGNSQIVTIATGFNKPVGIVVDAGGNLYVADSGDHSVKEILAVSGQTSITSPVVTIAAGFATPYGLALDGSGNLYVSDNAANTVTELLLSAAPSLNFATPTKAGATDGADGPLSVTIDNSGNALLVFPVPVSGDNPSVSSNFLWDDSSTCKQVDAVSPLAVGVAAGSSCTIAIDFKPDAIGTVIGTITLNDTAADPAGPLTTQSIVLTGTGTGDSQTIQFGAIAAAEYAGSTIALSATASSGLAVSFTSNTPALCTVSGSKASLLLAGVCKIKATQAGNDVYLAAMPVIQSFPVVRKSQAIRFTKISSTETALKAVKLIATSTSGLAVGFKSSTPKVCKVDGSEARLLTSGICTVEATQAGSAVFGPAQAVSQSFTVSRASQQISFPTNPSTEYAGKAMNLQATATSGLIVSFSTRTPAVCTVAGTKAALIKAGTCRIAATQGGNATYQAAASVTQNFTILAAR